MNYEYLQNSDLEQTRKDFLEKMKGYNCGDELIKTSESFGRITSEAVYAVISSPHFAASAMDGVAVQAKKTFGATETTPVDLKPEDYIIVDTGDPLPEGTDCVIMVEDIVHQPNNVLQIFAPAAPWQHVRQIGEDLCQGEMIIPSHTKIDAAAIGALLASGVSSILVRKAPTAGIIPTGDEIVSPTANPKPGEIIEFNSSIFKSMLESWGAKVIVYPIIPDQISKLTAAVKQAAAECDIVLMNAGSSAGRDDYTTSIVKENGELYCHGIAIRPGKPAVLGRVAGKAFIGVPGYPVSGVIIMQEIVHKLIEQYFGALDPKPQVKEAILTKRLMSSLKYQEYVRVQLGEVDGKLTAVPLARGAGVITSMVKADGIVTVPQNVEGWDAGQKVNVTLLHTPEQIKRTICCIGSHDPLMDEIGNFIRLTAPEYYFSSAHVGSMGGIMAIKRGEAHLAGIHILDEKTGTYNVETLKQYFPDGGITLLRGVTRLQGLMVEPGNPKHINGIEDIKRSDLSYVNRQKGAGTRILLDYLLKQNGISREQINGYTREEMTHLSVAVQIASHSANLGMGIYSAAKAYHLDFIPVCNEHYDFLMTNSFHESELFPIFQSVIMSKAFKDRLESMGGYQIDHIGDVLF